jgi:hypothetical protein
MSAVAQAVKHQGEDATKTDLNSLLKELSSSPDGLTGAEETKELAKYGPNAPEEKRRARC